MNRCYGLIFIVIALVGCATKKQESSVPWEEIIQGGEMQHMVQKEHIRCFKCETGAFPSSTDQLDNFKSTIPGCANLFGRGEFNYFPLQGNLRISNFINDQSGLQSFIFSKKAYDPANSKSSEPFIALNVDPQFLKCADLLANSEDERRVLEALEQYPGVTVQKKQ